jgi:hypothetical protein
VTHRRYWTALLLITLAAALSAAKCDQGQLDRACLVDPTLPFCKPSSSPSPSQSPGPEPTPSVAPPSPEASSPPPPTTMPSPAPTPNPAPEPSPSSSPSPEPTPVPVAQDCTPHPLPAVPVPVVHPGKAVPGLRCDTVDGVHVCAGRTAASDQVEWRTPEGDDCLHGIVYGLTSHNHEGAAFVLDHGLICGEKGGVDCQDAYCRRVFKGSLIYGPEGADNWGYTGNLPPVFCEGAPGPKPSPSPSPSPQPPSGYFNCNGEYDVPVETCSNYHLSRVSVGVHSIVDRPGCKANAECPANVGDKIIFNASPRYEDQRCTRGAVIPGNCVAARFTGVAEWSVVSGEPIKRDDGDNALGWLASFKPDQAGLYMVQVCVGQVCAQTKAPVVVD